MQTVALALLLLAIFALFSGRVQHGLQRLFQQTPRLIWLLPPVLTGYFLLASLLAGPPNGVLIVIVLVYTTAPVACLSWRRSLARQSASTVAAPREEWPWDALSILLLWLPLEFPAPAGRLIAKHAQGFLHSVAYGVAILLALLLFACYRRTVGMKYNLPRGWRDVRVALVGFALTAPILAVVGIAIGFIPLPHLPTATAGRMASAAAIIFAATALPEEILFRSLIQNLLMQRFGSGTRTLLVAALIFGAAHLDNGPQPLPNWRYMILATIAGLAYGKVFQKSSTVLSSTLFHALVDWTKHHFF